MRKIELLKNQFDLYKKDHQVYDTQYGELIVLKKNDLGFHIMSYAEPNQDIKTVGKNGVVSELKYDLRNRVYWIKRNGKEVQFSPRNINVAIPSYIADKTGEEVEFLSIVSTEENKEMYEQVYRKLSRMGLEQVKMMSRFLHRFMEDYSSLELLYKLLDEEEFRGINVSTLVKGEKSHLKALGINKTMWKLYNFLRNHEELESNVSINQIQSIQKRFDEEIQSLKISFRRNNEDEDKRREFSQDVDKIAQNLPRLYFDKIKWIVNLSERYGTYHAIRSYRNQLPHMIDRDYPKSLFLKEVKKLRSKYEEMQNRFDAKYQHRYDFDTPLDLANYFNLSEKDIEEYLLIRTRIEQGITRDVVNLYYDYINMNINMGVENYDKYPHSLVMAHDIASMNHKEVISNEKKEKWNEIYQGMKKYNWAYDGYMVFFPEEPEEIVKEGQQQSHCVGSYVQNVLSGTTNIFLMRDSSEPEKSLVTLELRWKDDKYKVTQAKKKFNQNPTNIEREKIRMFENYVNRKHKESLKEKENAVG